MPFLMGYKRCGCAPLEAPTVIHFYDELVVSFFNGDETIGHKVELLSECQNCEAVWNYLNDGIDANQLVEEIRKNVIALRNQIR